jgi:hypothetical protein
MSVSIKVVEYFYLPVQDKPGEAYRLLAELARGEVNLLAFTATPMGADYTQLVLFPESIDRLTRIAERGGFVLVGPHRAFLIQGDDRLGALVDIHEKLSGTGINVAASTGVTDGRGGYGYVVHVKSGDFDRAAQALGL